MTCMNERVVSGKGCGWITLQNFFNGNAKTKRKEEELVRTTVAEET